MKDCTGGEDTLAPRSRQRRRGPLRRYDCGPLHRARDTFRTSTSLIVSGKRAHQIENGPARSSIGKTQERPIEFDALAAIEKFCSMTFLYQSRKGGSRLTVGVAVFLARKVLEQQLHSDA